tara:strand:- start:310 stop:822 length:513 start_codon:yes stop_codon:yes gene_type:complete
MSEYSPLIEDDENIFILKRTTNIFKKDEFMLTKDNKVLCKFKKNSSKIKFNFNCKNITFNQKFKYFGGKKIFCIFLKNPVYGIVYFNKLGMISIYFKHKGMGFHSINENYNSKRNITILDEDNVDKFKMEKINKNNYRISILDNFGISKKRKTNIMFYTILIYLIFSYNY